MDEVDDQSAIKCSPVLTNESNNCTNTNEWNLLTFDLAMPLQKVLEDAIADEDPTPSLGCYSEALIPINEEKDGEQTGFEKLTNFLSFPLNCELFKATGFQGDEYFSNGDLQNVSGSQNFHLFNSQDFLDSVEPTAWDFAKFPCIDEAEECLETVISFKSVLSTLSDTEQQNGEPATSASLKSVVTTLNDSEQQNGEPATPASLKSVRCSLNDIDQQNGEPVMSASLKSALSTLDETEKQKGCSSAQAREGKKKTSGGKRKARSDDSQKQRPRDRQMIQDRVKELRELVPNGSKVVSKCLSSAFMNHHNINNLCYDDCSVALMLFLI